MLFTKSSFLVYIVSINELRTTISAEDNYQKLLLFVS